MCVLRKSPTQSHFIQTQQQVYYNNTATSTGATQPTGTQMHRRIVHEEFVPYHNNTDIYYTTQEQDDPLDAIVYPIISIPIPHTFSIESSLSSSSLEEDRIEHYQQQQYNQYSPPENVQQETMIIDYDDLDYRYSNYLNSKNNTSSSNVQPPQNERRYAVKKAAPVTSLSLMIDMKSQQPRNQPYQQKRQQQKLKSDRVFVVTSSTSEEQQQLYNIKTKSNSTKPSITTVTKEYVLDHSKDWQKYNSDKKNEKSSVKDYPINNNMVKKEYRTNDTDLNRTVGENPSTTPVLETKRTMIELESGSFTHLRTANETYDCIRTDSYLPHTCQVCCTTIYCIFDASYVLCPFCRVISSTNDLNNDTNVLHAGDSNQYNNNNNTYCGGVGLGFTYESLIEIQKDIIQCDAITDALDCNVPDQIGERISL